MLNFDTLYRGKRTPRLHPNGFVQLDLNASGTMRLHVWPETPLPAQKTHHPIHDHSFDMASVVLVGKLHNETFNTYSAYSLMGDPAYIEHRGVRVAGNDTVLQSTKNRVRLTLPFTEIVLPGQSYNLSQKTLHNSVAYGLTATIMTKFNLSSYGPRVMVPEGIEPDNVYRRNDIDDHVLWDVIEDALKAARREQ